MRVTWHEDENVVVVSLWARRHVRRVIHAHRGCAAAILIGLRHTLDDYLRTSESFETPESRAARAVFERAYAIAVQFIALREKRGLTQTQLAELSGVHQSEIGRIERGSINPTEPTLVRLADALGADLRLGDRSSG